MFSNLCLKNLELLVITLQGHGFLTVYNGGELSYKISQLRRNAEYKFRVRTVVFF